MAEPITIGVGATKWIKDANTKMISLFFPSSSGTLSFHDETDTDYQVPVGKKFILCRIDQGGFGGSSSRGFDYYHSPTTDTITGATKIATYHQGLEYSASGGTSWGGNASQSRSSQSPNTVECYIEIPAGKFIVGVSTTADCIISGVETDV